MADKYTRGGPRTDASKTSASSGASAPKQPIPAKADQRAREAAKRAREAAAALAARKAFQQALLKRKALKRASPPGSANASTEG